MTTTRTMRFMRTAVLAAALAVGAGAMAYAEDGKPGLSAAGDIGAALGKLGAGRDVEIVLANGKSYRGKLGTVGGETVLLTQIAGKEFYDVLIDLDEVAAVELRVRGN
ncbi:MAG: hypothetical protein IT293_01050 [Deltaproteobacteria bacterium]|nr:hypothetical protein [Deltaproteobacteria bacterium]